MCMHISGSSSFNVMGGISGIDGVGEKRGDGHGDIGGELRGEDKSLSRIPEPGPSIRHRSFPALCLRIKIMTTGMMKVHSTEPNPVAMPTMAVTDGKTTAKLAAADRIPRQRSQEDLLKN